MKRIELAQEQFQPSLKHLHDFALNLQEKNLAQLSTYINGKGGVVRLDLQIPDKNLLLVSFANLLRRGGLGEIIFWPECEAFATNSSQQIGELIGPVKSNSKIRYRRLTRLKTSLPDVLAAIQDAYSEVNGPPIS